MDPAESLAERIAENLSIGAVGVIISAFGQVMTISQGSTEAAPASAELLFFLIQTMPGWVTLFGIIIATVAAGPFGFVGAAMETVAVNSFFNPSTEPNLGLLFMGGIFVLVGTPIPWWTLLVRVFS